MKMMKAFGPDNMHVEVWECSGEVALEVFLEILNF